VDTISTYASFLGAASAGILAFLLLNWTVGMAICLPLFPIWTERPRLVGSVLVAKNAVCAYLFSSLVATLVLVRIAESDTPWIGFALLGFLLIWSTMAQDVYGRRKRAREEFIVDRFGVTDWDPFLLLGSLAVFVVGIIMPAVVVTPFSNAIVGIITWVLGLPILSFWLQFAGTVFALGTIASGLVTAGVLLLALVAYVDERRMTHTDSAGRLAAASRGTPEFHVYSPNQ
jgi:hypothetical protein